MIDRKNTISITILYQFRNGLGRGMKCEVRVCHLALISVNSFVCFAKIMIDSEEFCSIAIVVCSLRKKAIHM